MCPHTSIYVLVLQNPSNAEDTSLVEDFFVNMSVNHNVQVLSILAVLVHQYKY